MKDAHVKSVAVRPTTAPCSGSCATWPAACSDTDVAMLLALMWPASSVQTPQGCVPDNLLHSRHVAMVYCIDSSSVNVLVVLFGLTDASATPETCQQGNGMSQADQTSVYQPAHRVHPCCLTARVSTTVVREGAACCDVPDTAGKLLRCATTPLSTWLQHDLPWWHLGAAGNTHTARTRERATAIGKLRLLAPAGAKLAGILHTANVLARQQQQQQQQQLATR
jgi:hypothetical protein